MNKEEISELQTEVMRCFSKESKTGDIYWSIPNPRVYDSECVGYKLCINKTTVDESSLNCLEAIAEKHKLKIMHLKEGILVIYTPRNG
jgi:hypothetical protein